jgi:serine/threonine protein kinase/Flp pilus assembly protein TadD
MDRFPKPATPTLTPPPISNLTGSSVSPFASASVSMPQPGDEFHGFRLTAELGRGTFARVFLAKQKALANRDVAVKVTLRPTREPERIARLQHTNVVPVYSVHGASSMQIICMPYLGRRTLADVLVGYRKSQISAGQSTRKALATRKGSSVAGSRSRTGFRMPIDPSPIDSAADTQPASDPLVGNIDAVLQIISQLAAGLAHAHERGVLHLDLKPANVLIADTGEPMLLDFNLSYASFEQKREVVGGTIPYMAPEQLLDLQTRGKGQVDARTDIYSLGVMAFELLAGKHPFPVTSRTLTEFDGLIAARMKGPPAIRKWNADISPAVQAIVSKMLAPNPEDRYQLAADLQEDLDRQLSDRPLRFAVDRSPLERFGKWRRRHPRTLDAMLLAAVLPTAGGSGAYAFNQSEKRAVGEAEARARDTRDGLESVRLDLVLPTDTDARARGSEKALALLAVYGLPNDADWMKNSAFQRVPESQRAGLTGDIGELLLLLAQTRWEDGKAVDRTTAARDALRLNALAAECFGDSLPPFLVRQKAELEGGDKPALRAPTTPRERFLESTALLAAGQYRSAIELLQKVVLASPEHGAAQFCLAYCMHQLGWYEKAIERYNMACAQLPKDPRPPFYCGIAYALRWRIGGSAEAEDSFTRAIELDPRRGDFYRNRGIARMDLGKWDEAEEDLTAALKHGASALQIHNLRMRVREQRGDADGAAADRQAFAGLRPQLDLDFLTLGATHTATDPKAALAEFRAAEEKNPRSLPAMQNQAHILSKYLHDEAGALKVLDRIAELYPDYGPTRASRAILLAKLGKREEALREAEQVGKLSTDPCVTYRRACTFAITSTTNQQDRKQAIALLKKAFREGYHHVRSYESDPNLDALRDLPEFGELLKAVKNLL